MVPRDAVDTCTKRNARMSSSTLTLYNAVGILTDLIDATDAVARCDNCNAELDEVSWNICTGPVLPEGTPGVPKHHEGHTACTTCAMDPLSYIAEGGACRPCLNALGGRRSSVVKAGVALRPAVKNILANRMIECCTAAKRSVEEAQDAQDAERRQEGADRRAAAVEDVRRRRAEEQARIDRQIEETLAEERRLAQEKLEEERRAAQERLEMEDRRAQAKIAEERRLAQEKLEEERRVAQERLEMEERRLAQERIEEDRRAQAKIAEERRLAQEKLEEERRVAQETMEEERRLAQETMEEERRVARERNEGGAFTQGGAPARKRKPQTQDAIQRRLEASRVARNERKHKLERHDALVAQNEVLTRQIAGVQDIAIEWMIWARAGNAGSRSEEECTALLTATMEREMERIAAGDEDDSEGLAID